MAQSSRLIAAGLIAGLVLATPVLVFLGKAFPYTSHFDPMPFAVPIVVLTLAGLAAAYGPARRAGRVDACAALRSE